MKFRIFALVLPAFLLSAEEPSLTARLSRSIPFSEDFSVHPVPRFRGKALGGCDNTRSRIRLWDSRGSQVLDRPLQLPGASKVSITDVAVSSDGNIAVAASTMSSLGQAAGVITWLNSQGDLVRAVVTTPFAVRRVMFARDGTLWALGREHDARFNDVREFDLLRRYDSHGRFFQSALPRSVFPFNRISPSDDALLNIAGESITVLSITSSMWVTLSLDGRITGQGTWSREDLSKIGWISGMASTPEGGLFVSVEMPQGGATVPVRPAARKVDACRHITDSRRGPGADPPGERRYIPGCANHAIRFAALDSGYIIGCWEATEQITGMRLLSPVMSLRLPCRADFR